MFLIISKLMKDKKIIKFIYKFVLFSILLSILLGLNNLKPRWIHYSSYDVFINRVKFGDTYIFTKFFLENKPFLKQRGIVINYYEDKSVLKPRYWHQFNGAFANLLIFPGHTKKNLNYNFNLSKIEDEYLFKKKIDTIKFRGGIISFNDVMLSNKWNKEKNWGIFKHKVDNKDEKARIYLLPLNWRKIKND